jgi:putative ABC transport system permease protein
MKKRWTDIERKAIGVRLKDVMTQFLIEFILMSVVGGCIGIITGVVALFLSSTYGNLSLVISLNSMLVSFLFAALVGFLFDMYPVWKSANANEIDALHNV